MTMNVMTVSTLMSESQNSVSANNRTETTLLKNRNGKNRTPDPDWRVREPPNHQDTRSRKFRANRDRPT